MPIPTNKALYIRIAAKVKRQMPKHSAYRSMRIVKEYKAAGGGYSGSKDSGKLTRWQKEKWQNQHGKTGYQHAGDIYRPTKKISSKTPKLMSSIKRSGKLKSKQNEKRTKGRVKRF